MSSYIPAMVLPATPTNVFLLIGDGVTIGVDVDSTCHLLFPCRVKKIEILTMTRDWPGPARPGPAASASNRQDRFVEFPYHHDPIRTVHLFSPRQLRCTHLAASHWAARRVVTRRRRAEAATLRIHPGDGEAEEPTREPPPPLTPRSHRGKPITSTAGAKRSDARGSEI
ncbi:hypothetical protein GUJ93_ZPchr0006g41099 [Zizania palustris]|uniref:Uncharacterized protein n=1 Tax=Zizania palustris TaxID=103762 RepID=A0A8J5VIN9_ZIZPA|nr:hypothetical protein GUJ93_ZPchr0006g41099 [Zizania palustris]